MIDDTALDRIDDLARYLPPDVVESRSAVASGYTASELYREHVFSDEQMARLDQVAELVRRDGRLCEDEELLDAWLETFEVLSSIRADDLPNHRTAGAPRRSGGPTRKGPTP